LAYKKSRSRGLATVTKIHILGQEYLIKSDVKNEQVQEVADFLNSKCEEIREGMEGLSERKTAILAAFHIANDYFQLRQEQQDFLAEYRRRSEALITRIDSVLGGVFLVNESSQD
jgi:cell division protein ZapA